MKPTVNKVILESIPINRKVKGYWVRKYLRIATNCGIDEAQRKIKHLRVVIMSYIADDDRRSNLGAYLKQSGFRNNGQLRSLFQYAECQPHVVLSFLKLFSSEQKPCQSADAAAWATKQRLNDVKVRDEIPTALSEWFRILSLSQWERLDHYWNLKLGRCDGYAKRFAQCHTSSEWLKYWNHWYGLIRKGWKSPLQGDYKLVFPEVYKDFDVTDSSSEAYQADFADLCSMHMVDFDAPLNEAELFFVDGYLDDEIQDQLYSILWGESPAYSGLFQNTTLVSGHYVGHIHHIQKKGGGTELRDIAVPNRFIQMALSPGAMRLDSVLRQLPQDASYNQAKFDIRIQNRVNNPRLYQGSVDLSKATDNLPCSWGRFCVDQFGSIFGPAELDVQRSLDLFWTVARAKWEDQGFLIEWTCGQPLGSLPSFRLLGITHNLLVEALAFEKGLAHSPYAILGDDIVFFNKKLRRRYISLMQSRGIPLSLHKSFTGRLSEFAGKLFVKNCIPFYTSDHSPITYETLFDWQRATGIRIPWEHLPRGIKRRVMRNVRAMMKPEDGEKNLMKTASMAYYHAQCNIVLGRGSVRYPDEGITGKSEIFFEVLASSENIVPDALLHTGITLIGDGHPVVLMNARFAKKGNYFERFRPVQLPSWYKDKFRPCATDTAIRGGLASYLGHL